MSARRPPEAQPELQEAPKTSSGGGSEGSPGSRTLGFPVTPSRSGPRGSLETSPGGEKARILRGFVVVRLSKAW